MVATRTAVVNQVKGRQTNAPTFDMNRIESIGEKLLKLRDELLEIFPERDDLVNQIIFALLTREHVLIHGAFGTGKSDLVHTLFSTFTDAEVFAMGLSKFMTESHIIGLPDPKMMREEGVMHYRPEGSILEAHFAELDEFFDASPPLLRTLLGILNERIFKRGRQVERAKLYTAIASTNGSPEEELKRNPELGAVVDRFLFHSKVEYLTDEESRRRMYEKFLGGETPTVTLKIDELKYISEAVVSARQIDDPEFVAVYDEIIEAYRKTSGKTVSDRRACKLLQVIEANALLQGRFDVDLEDILAVRYGLCMGGDKEEFAAFMKVAEPIIVRAKEAQAQSVDDVQKKLLLQLETEIPRPPFQQMSETTLVETIRKLGELKRKVEDIKPQLKSTADLKQRVLTAVVHTEAEAKKTLFG